MKKYQEWLLRSFIVCFGLTVALLCIFWLPSVASYSAKTFPNLAYLRYPVYIWMVITTVPFYIALHNANNLLTLIQTKAAFTESSTKHLGNISYCGLAVAVSYIVLGGVLFIAKACHPGIILAFSFLILTSMTISFFAKLLKTLLEEALRFKNENDLTI